MTAPNLRSPVTVTGKTKPATLTASLTSVLANPSESGTVLKVNTIRAANLLSAAVTVSIALTRGAATTYLLKNGSVSGGTALIASDKNEYIYLEEGDDLKAQSSAESAIDLTINYEEVS